MTPYEIETIQRIGTEISLTMNETLAGYVPPRRVDIMLSATFHLARAVAGAAQKAGIDWSLHEWLDRLIVTAHQLKDRIDKHGHETKPGASPVVDGVLRH